MPVSKEFVARVTDALSAARPIRVKPMFGGIGIYCEEAFFAIGDDDKLFFKVSPTTVGDYESRGMGPWILNGQENLKYREVPADILNDPETLGPWIDDAVAIAKAAPTKKKK